MEFLGPQKAEKSAKPKWGVFSGTPCMFELGGLNFVKIASNIARKSSTGCPVKQYPRLFLKFLGFLGVQKFHLGHFLTALSMQILKKSTILLFGKIQTDIFVNYHSAVILKVNILCVFLIKHLSSHKQSLAVMSTNQHS